MTYVILSNYCSIELTFQYFYFIFEYYWFCEQQWNQYKLLLFLWWFIIRLMFFSVLFIIFVSLIVDMFICIDRISVHWYWNLSSSVIENYLWAISKPDIRILSPNRFVKGCVKGSGWVFRLVYFNCLIYFI